MKPGNESPTLYLASSGAGRSPLSDVSARLRIVMSRLEDCQTTLVDVGELGTAQLVAMAMLQLRMRMHNVSDAELRALCDALAPDEPARDSSKVSCDAGS